MLIRLLRFLVEPEKKLLPVRCGTGSLLATVMPGDSKGVDISAEIVESRSNGIHSSISRSLSRKRSSVAGITKPPFLPNRVRVGAALDEVGEKALGQILRLLRSMSLFAQEGVQ